MAGRQLCGAEHDLLAHSALPGGYFLAAIDASFSQILST